MYWKINLQIKMSIERHNKKNVEGYKY